MENNSINIYKKIYKIRGEKVMFDFDLAEIYGYETKAFNQQVKRNIKKFDDDFMFRLSREEVDELVSGSCCFVRSQNVTSRNVKMFSGQFGGSRYLPYAFTESGIYMVMTILKGELATTQSKALIRAFRAMKDYIKNVEDALLVKNRIIDLEEEVRKIADEMNNVIKKSEISPILLNFNEMIIDDYINIKTLRCFQRVKVGVEIIIFSDNKGNYLHESDYVDFMKEFPGLKIEFKKTLGKIHDRFIIIDYGFEYERVFHCGSSIKDAGRRVTIINKLDNDLITKPFNNLISQMLDNPVLVLGH